VGDLPSTLADIRALMVAGSSWAKELFFENSEGIGAVRRSETQLNAKVLITLPLSLFWVLFAEVFFREMFATILSNLPGET